MKYLAFIPYVNREDFLKKAINSLKFKIGTDLVLIDNSNEGEHLNPKNYKGIEIIVPPVPLNFSQTMNLIQKIALERGLDWYIFMHNDAKATKTRVNALFDKIEEAFKIEKKWLVIFTFYDCLCAYNTKNAEKVGKWDTNFVQYFADNDYFRRVRLKNYKTLESGNVGMTHVASTTVRNDYARWLANQTMYAGYRNLYNAKWGGLPGFEKYKVPYDKPQLEV